MYPEPHSKGDVAIYKGCPRKVRRVNQKTLTMVPVRIVPGKGRYEEVGKPKRFDRSDVAVNGFFIESIER